MREKCQKCSKPASVHVTDVDRSKSGKYHEFHFCDEHARQFLAPPEDVSAPSISDLAAGLVKSGSALREPSAIDKKTCPVCQITFGEFKNTARLGCPHDYEVFRDQLMPLLENIHDETRHCGKVPRRAPQNSQRQTELIELRNKLKRAIAAEDYELAARLRDEIKNLELEQGR